MQLSGIFVPNHCPLCVFKPQLCELRSTPTITLKIVSIIINAIFVIKDDTAVFIVVGGKSIFTLDGK